MASKIFFSHQKVYFWISAFDHRAIVVPKMHIVHWLCWLGICFGPEYAVMLSSTRIVHVLFWGQYQTKCLRRIYAANVNIYNPFTYFVTAVELSLFAKLPNIEHCCYCNRRDPKSTIAHPLITKQQLCCRHDNHQMHRHKNQQRPNHANKRKNHHHPTWILGALNPQ